MSNRWWLLPSAVVLALISGGLGRAEDRSLVILFGPNSEESARQTAHSVADVAHDWLKTPGASAELRRAGLNDGQELTKYMESKDLEKNILDAAGVGRQTDLQGFLNALDKASYALARRPGKRVLLLALETPAPDTVKAMNGGADELESRISQTIDFCRSKGEHVVVLDPSPASKEPPKAFQLLASDSGGTLVREPKSLGNSMAIVAPAEKIESASSPAAAAAPAGLPVTVRFVRMLPLRARNTVTDMGPMTGFVIVECPIGALQARDDSGKFLIDARFTETVRNAEGKNVWEAKKDISIKEPLKKKDVRRAGNLYYMREVQLPGGQYTIEGAVDDLVAEKSGKAATQSLRASDSLPGFAVSDAMFVRPLKESSDRFEADQVLAYNGTALAPLLDPVFTANEPFELRLYFVIYPDIGGAKPEISLEILRNGQAVGRSQLAFNDVIKNTAGENGTLSGKTEQKHEFPYLADLRDATFDKGQYEARLTVRQGRNTVTRTVPFRVQ